MLFDFTTACLLKIISLRCLLLDLAVIYLKIQFKKIKTLQYIHIPVNASLSSVSWNLTNNEDGEDPLVPYKKTLSGKQGTTSNNTNWLKSRQQQDLLQWNRAGQDV